ncbi:MAG TPA: hypothetical protein VHG90_02995 [Acidimicrobiales bacterium]|nr:hypothetical protein [Acidimicrobiales bacterium]
MTRVVRAELALLTRRWVVTAAAVAAVAFAAITTLASVLSAQPAGSSPPGRGITVEALSAVGGATQAFRVGTGFLGVVVLVIFAARMAGEFSHGTLRTLLLHEPRRLRVVAGKVLALVVFAAATLAAAAVFSVLLALALAPSQGISTTEWFGMDGLGAAAGDYLSALAGVAAWAVYGTLLAVLVRSVPVAVGVAVAWAGPFEHLLGQAWSTAIRFLPGLQVEALAAGGTTDVSYRHALALTLAYVATALCAGLFSLWRRDITA